MPKQLKRFYEETIKTVIIRSDKGFVGWDGHGFGQSGVSDDCMQCFGNNAAKIRREVGLLDGEDMYEVEIKIGRRINLKGQ